MEDVKLIKLDEVDSTNRFLREYTGDEGRKLTVVTAEYQTAGCGQGGNTWESERGKNLIFSIMFRPRNLPASRQFGIIEASAYAVLNSLEDAIPERFAFSGGFSIKWPNDIYWHDRKIAGLLSECEVRGGMITRCIVGIGINIGQTEFKSDAPNPISLCPIIYRVFSKKRIENKKKLVLENFIYSFLSQLRPVRCGYPRLYHIPYLHCLYRKEGIHEFEDKYGRFRASLETVEEDGRLVLKREDGSLSKYAFKEVRFVLE